MDSKDIIDRDAALAAFAARDRAFDGRFLVAVTTTGVYCRPSCPARRPRPENVRILPDGQAARVAGFRPCLRCRPDEVAPDRVAVERAHAAMAAAETALSLADLAALTGYAPHHFHRIFKRATGSTPSAWQRAIRARRLEDALNKEKDVTQAIYAAGYAGHARAYADATDRLGMAPARWKAGGAGETIRFAIAATGLGPLLVAATDKGLCRIAFDEDEGALRARFPKAELVSGDRGFGALVDAVVAEVDGRALHRADLPLDLRGTAFQEAVWTVLRAIKPGETLTYKQVAARAGKAGAVRAAGSACGDNPLAVLVPCHRVLRSDGSLGGYAYGLERKRVLLAREGYGDE